MLVLSRRTDERIRIKLEDGRHIWVLVTRIDRNKVRLGISAPPSIILEREEVIRDHSPPPGESPAG